MLCTSVCFFQYKCFLVLDVSIMWCQCQEHCFDKYVNNIAYGKCVYERETWWLAGIQVSYSALPLLPCVWPAMNCQIRLFQRETSVSTMQFLCFKLVFGRGIFKSELLTLSSVGRNGDHQRTIHQIQFRIRWGTTAAQRDSFAPCGLQSRHRGGDEQDPFVARPQDVLDSLDLSWAMLSEAEHHSSEDSALVFSKSSCCSC